MIKNMFLTLGAVAFLAACTEDYKDWSAPMSTQTPAAVVLTVSGEATATPVEGTINFADIDAAATMVKVCTFTAPAAADSVTKGDDFIVLDSTVTLPLTDGCIAVSDLKAYIEGVYGKAPYERTINAYAYTTYSSATASTRCFSAPFQLKAQLVAPHISENYYIVGGTLDWGSSAASKEQKFQHSDVNVYDDPVFTITIPLSAEGDTWFAIGDDEALDAIANSNDYSKLLGTTSGNGNSGETGFLAPRSELTDEGSFKVPQGGMFARVTIDMMNASYTVQTLSFSEYFYEIGSESGWAASHALRGANFDGKYQGYYYLDGEFKFKPNADNWDDDLEYVDGDAMGGSLTSGGGPNCPDPGAGFYRIDLDAANLSYSLKKIEVVSIIGTVNGNWDTDTDLTYNKEEGCWEVTTDLNAGEMKFRGNHNWDGDVDLGGSFDNLVKGGSNIAVEAGNYTIKLYISIDGQHKAVVTKN